jgi:hypothetical protein
MTRTHILLACATSALLASYLTAAPMHLDPERTATIEDRRPPVGTACAVIADDFDTIGEFLRRNP